VKYKKTVAALSILAALLSPCPLFAGDTQAPHASEPARDATKGSIITIRTAAVDTSDTVVFSDYPAASAGQAATGVKDSSSSALSQSGASSGVSAISDGSAGGFLLDDSTTELDSNLLKPLNVFNHDFINPVDNNIRAYSGVLKKHFSRWLTRSGRYLDMMKGIFRENGLPEDLAFLAMVESGFNPMAYSWAQASGPWQFIRGTAKKYGLNVNTYVDERRDPIKSTKAAARYLKDLYDMFGSWALALASYNSGEGNVSRAVLRNGTLDFWELRNTGSLAAETKEYVPKFLAAKIIAQNPEAYGFEDVEYDAPLEFDEVVVECSTSLETAARCCGVTVQDIKDLNPELKRWCTPPNSPGYTLRIPKGTKDAFLASYGELPERDKTGFKEHIVRKGETLKGIADRYGVSVEMLRQANELGRKARVTRGQSILIPEQAAVAAESAEPAAAVDAVDAKVDGVATEETLAAAPEIDITDVADDATDTEAASSVPDKGNKDRSPSYHTVKRGETLSDIAHRYGTSASKIASLNGIGKRSKIHAGQRLLVSDKGRKAGNHRKPRAA